MNYPSRQTSLYDLVFVLFKRKWSFLGIIFIGVFSSAVWVLCVREDVYTAKAKILVKLGQEQAPPATVVGGTPLVMGNRAEDVNSEAEILQNTELIAKIVDEIGLDRPIPIPPPKPGFFPLLRYRVRSLVRTINQWIDDEMAHLGLREPVSPRQKAIALIQGGLKVQPGRESNVFSPELTLPDREGSAFVLNRLITYYMEFRSKLYRTRGIELFQKSLDTNNEDLNQAEQELQRFEAQGDISLLQAQQTELVKQIAETEPSVKNAEIAFQDAAAHVTRLDGELGRPEPNFGALGEFDRDSFPNTILRQIATLQQEREALRMTQLDNSDRVQNNRNQMNVLVGMLAANLRSVLAEKQSDYLARKQDLENLEARLTKLHQEQMEWDDLKRKTAGLEENVTFYRRKLEEAKAESQEEQQRIGNVILVQAATPPAGPSGLRKTWLLGLAMILSATLALVWISVLEILDHGIHRADVLESELNAPVLAVVPSTPMALLTAKLTSFGLGREREASHQKIAATLAAAVRGGQLSSVLISSIKRNKNVSALTFEVALLLAQYHGLKTLLVEMDFRRPKLLKRRKLYAKHSFYAVSEEAILPSDAIQSDSSGVDVIPSGRKGEIPRRDPVSTLSRILGQAKNYDIVLIAAPPVLETAWLPTIGSALSQMILIVDADRTSAEVLGRTKKEIDLWRLRLFGTVFNQQKRYVPRWIERLVE